jgi:hypothetical protein
MYPLFGVGRRLSEENHRRCISVRFYQSGNLNQAASVSRASAIDRVRSIRKMMIDARTVRSLNATIFKGAFEMHAAHFLSFK